VNAQQPSLPRRVDRAVYQFERWLAGLLFLAMALIMFAHVVIRVFERQESKLMAALCWIARLTQLTDIRASEVGETGTLIAQFVTTFLICYVGLRTMKPIERIGPLNRAYAALGAAAATGLGALIVYLLLKSFPNNIVGAPQYALMAMLWVGFLGASIATYERRHLALEMGEKIWPKRLIRYVQALAFLSAAAMTAFLARMAWVSLVEHYDSWKLNPLTGKLDPTAVSKWMVFIIFPYTFIVMGIRFLAQSGLAVTGKLAPPPSEIPMAVPGSPAEAEEAKS
jgi:TRAP-type C4-dicarboxylate transport system permease small subunit